jgi:clan AA aspartic protease
MNGFIDASGRALLRIEVQSDSVSVAHALEVWIDTGFTGDLVLPRPTIEQMALRRSGSVDAVLADGSRTELNTYSCFVHWFGSPRQLEVIANDGEAPLLGVGMLLGLELRATYRTMELSLAPA